MYGRGEAPPTTVPHRMAHSSNEDVIIDVLLYKGKNPPKVKHLLTPLLLASFDLPVER